MTGLSHALASRSRYLEGLDVDHAGDLDHDHGENITSDAAIVNMDSNKPWAEVVMAAFIVNLATLSGVIVLAFTLILPRRLARLRHKLRRGASINNDEDGSNSSTSAAQAFILSPKIDHLILPSFAAGALIATSVFLIIPECLELLQEGATDITEEFEMAAAAAEEGDHVTHDHGRWLIQQVWRLLQNGDHDHEDEQDYYLDLANSTVTHNETLEDYSNAATHEEAHAGHDHAGHADSFWKFGAALLGGYLLPFVLSSLFPVPHTPEQAQECEECRVRALNDQSVRLEAQRRHMREQDVVLGCASAFVHKSCCDGAGGCKRHVPLVSVSAVSTNLESLEEKSAAESIQEEVNVDDDVFLPGNSAMMDDALVNACDEECPLAQVGGDKTMLPTSNLADASLSSAPTVPACGPRHVDWSLAISILLGDGFHNFTDGVFIGNAFMFCQREVAYAIVAATLYHEIAQEIADFCLLTEHCHLTTWKALGLNFASGFSVLVGALLILSLGMSSEATGVILAMSAGVYINIGASEVVPRIQDNPDHKTPASKAIFFLCFSLGAVPIGLVLLNHSHGCSNSE